MVGAVSRVDSIRVLEVGTYVTAPKATRILAEFGAEVIKVERRSGSPWREVEDDESEEKIQSLYAMIDRGKKSLGIDLSSEKGQDVFKNLAADADVVVENMAPGTMESFGLGYKDIRAVNEDIIYCSISGYGQTGPLADEKSLDFMAQGMSSLAFQNAKYREDGKPSLSGWFVADEVTALTASISIMGALLGGKGTYIDVSLFDAMIGMFEPQAAMYMGGDKIQPPATPDRSIGPKGLYEAEDGYLTLWTLPPVSGKWQALWEVLELDEWAEAEKYVNNDEIKANLEEIDQVVSSQFKSKPRDYWLDRLSDAGIISAPVLTTEEAFTHEQLKSRKVLSDGKDEVFDGSPQVNFPAIYSNYDIEVSEPLATLGEHTQEILDGIGLTNEEIDDLYDDGVVS